MSDVYQSLAHSKWDCKYHVVFVPKRRRKVIFADSGANWARSSTHWRSRRSVGLWKDTSCQTMCTCASRFRPSTRSPR